MSNWGPLLIQLMFSRMFEKLVHKKLCFRHDSLGSLRDAQFGFRKSSAPSFDVLNNAFERSFAS